MILAGPTGGDHHVFEGHPERPARITAVQGGIADLRLGSDLVVVDAPEAPRSALRRVHPAEYLDGLEGFCLEGGGALDADTFARADSWEAAVRAAGAGLAAVEAVRARGGGVAFAVARPPGHHAERSRAMGFCLLNNISVAAASVLAAGERVAILDWDVHHGNGTQDIFWDEPGVLYVSMHQSPLYPGTGQASEIGGPNALGTVVNIPLPPGSTGDVVQLAMNEIAAPAIDEFGAGWLFVSCGFDAHRADPLADLSLSSADFGALASKLAELAAPPRRIVLFLEGGYDLEAVRRSTAATVGALVGVDAATEAPTSGGPGADAVRAAMLARERALEGGGTSP